MWRLGNDGVYGRNALFAIRGVLTFVAFTEIAAATRCLLPVDLPDDRERGGLTYIRAKVFNGLTLPHGLATDDQPPIERVLGHLFGLYSMLNGLVLLHLAIYVHYRPLVSLALISLTTKLFFYLSQAWLGTIVGAPNLVFPVVTCIVSMAVTTAVPFVTGRPHFD